MRGKVDGWDFKAYVLGTLFYRYLCDHLFHIILGYFSKSASGLHFEEH
ncbi:hypothetical protein MHK11_11415 [Corynebacterium aurimucosum]|nr:hypothetical protein [Corynebacterium aurimucosum]MCG7448859.1 hypothetical protein [Corynebacterium aurimucosum]